MLSRIVLVSLLTCFVPQPAVAQVTYVVSGSQAGYAATPVAYVNGGYGVQYLVPSAAYQYGSPVIAPASSYTYGAPLVSTQQVYSYPTNAVYSYGVPVAQRQVIYSNTGAVQIPAGSMYGVSSVQLQQTHTYGSPVMYWSTPGYGYRSY